MGNRLIYLYVILSFITLSVHARGKEKVWAPRVDKPLVTPSARPYTPTAGLQDRHIAVWQSHGWYYERKLDRWEWQRARLMQTVEDLYTQSYVLPYLVPMLENAGANVLLPRERDVAKEELILDNDRMTTVDGTYTETIGEHPWTDGDGQGFAHLKRTYSDGENPFRDGTYRQTTTTRKGAESQAAWIPSIPSKGEYAVYVSYKSLPGSTDDALYTVYHLGGKTEFRVNQRMGGGTWIYLGRFLFTKGENPMCGRITLSNRSARPGRILTADAVKIGGGMGNIVRNGLQSNHPRFTEGARYWLQWAGAPDSVYTPFHGENDYNDDYCSRPLWVNWMGGGSDVLPDRQGLRVPLDLSLAFHTDAGTTKGDATIGTLMIYESETEGRTTYANGASRELAGILADTIQKLIVRDVRALHEPEWNCRGIWNKPYFEARVPEVPAVLIELLSHQNFADMRYGLDPRFRFTVSRAIYKGMLRFISSQRSRPCVVQPLPPHSVMASVDSNGDAHIRWRATDDPLEPSASPSGYVVYTRIDSCGWDNGVMVEDTTYSVPLDRDHIYSWKICAVNEGGQSFPSETVSAGIPQAWQAGMGTALVINGFQRISAPADFCFTTSDSIFMAGFLDDIDHGVPYIQDISHVGSQKEFCRSRPWTDDDAGGFGDSYGDRETDVVSGNTFDYAYIHGLSLMACGRAFSSCDRHAVEDGTAILQGHPFVDLILGKQCQTKMGNGKNFPLEFKTFTPAMQAAIKSYLLGYGGHVLVSGAYVGTDLWANPLAPPLDEDKAFAQDVLKYKWRTGRADRTGRAVSVRSALSEAGDMYRYANTLNARTYVVESPDAIEPSCPDAHTVMRYAGNNLSAGVAYWGKDYRTFVMGFPFESITNPEMRHRLMRQILEMGINTKTLLRQQS